MMDLQSATRRAANSARSVTFAAPDYLKHFHDFRRKLHKGGVRDPPVDPIDKYARSDGVRDGAEFRFLVGFPPGGGELPRESRRQPFAHFRRHRVRLHFRQLVVLVGQSPTGGNRGTRR